jgi:hypothetical protein
MLICGPRWSQRVNQRNGDKPSSWIRKRCAVTRDLLEPLSSNPVDWWLNSSIVLRGHVGAEVLDCLIQMLLSQPAVVNSMALAVVNFQLRRTARLA